jgi:hypothetical protein
MVDYLMRNRNGHNFDVIYNSQMLGSLQLKTASQTEAHHDQGRVGDLLGTECAWIV